VEEAGRGRVGLRFRGPFDDGQGLPAATKLGERIGVAAALVATLWLALVSFWEIGAPFGAGHFTAATAVATAGENMLQHLTVGAVTHYTDGPPAPSDYYCHHPLGCFWTAALFVNVFGHHDWVCRLPAALLSSAMPLLLYRFGRAAWGPLAGGVAALAFGAVPIALSYANFFALEVPVMFGIALGSAFLARFLQTGRRRFGALAFAGLLYACASDWAGFVFTGLVWFGLFLRCTIAYRFYPALDRRRLFWFLGVTALASAALLGFHVALFQKLGQFEQLLRQGELRSAGADMPLSDVLESRKYWILLAFTPLAIFLGKLAAPVSLLGLTLGRRELELVPLCVLVAAAVQYVVFKQGADVHFFWPHYFALYFAYALGSLTHASERAFVGLAAFTKRSKLAIWAPIAAFCLGIAVVLALVPDAVRALVYARKTGGRFNEKGHLIHPDLDKSKVLTELKQRLAPDTLVGVDNSMKPAYFMDWTLERPLVVSRIPTSSTPPGLSHFVIDARFSSRAGIQALVSRYAVRAYGSILVADLEAPHAPLIAFDLELVEPTAFTRFFVSGSHALPRFRESPLLTWELREHLNQQPNPLPNAAPRSRDELRAAHNLALHRHDDPLAARLRNELLAGADLHVARRYGDLSLLAARHVPGTSEFLEVYFMCHAPLTRDAKFTIWSEVEAAPIASLVPKDERRWDTGMPFAIPSSLFRPGFIYRSSTELLRRPGRERYLGTLRGAPGRHAAQQLEPVVLLTLGRGAR
jgi:4-amino-4-deoxy-L-arabinose transferase-like glycosyltransferase